MVLPGQYEWFPLETIDNRDRDPKLIHNNFVLTGKYPNTYALQPEFLPIVKRKLQGS